MLRKIPSWVQLLFLSGILVPIAAYVVGQWIIGPYEGNFGLLGYFFSIYSDALQAKPTAWILLTGRPLMLLSLRIGLKISARAKPQEEA